MLFPPKEKSIVEIIIDLIKGTGKSKINFPPN